MGLPLAWRDIFLRSRRALDSIGSVPGRIRKAFRRTSGVPGRKKRIPGRERSVQK